jgi:pentose-5-phosphate-3-epimerase
MELKITPSILGVDYGRMNEHLAELAPFSDMFHVDVMDGNFVDNLTVGAPVVKRIKTDVPLDCHLMINNPHRYIKDFAEAGAYSITIHAEASLHLSDDMELMIKQHHLPKKQELMCLWLGLIFLKTTILPRRLRVFVMLRCLDGDHFFWHRSFQVR